VGMTQKCILTLLALSFLFFYPGGVTWQSSTFGTVAQAGRGPASDNLTAAPEVEPNDTPERATPISLTVQQLATMSGAIGTETDVDYFSFNAPAGARLWAYVDTGGPRAPLARDNSVLTLFDGDGLSVIEVDDDDGLGTGLNGAILSAYASVIGGRTLPPTGGGANRTYYLQVKSATSDRVNPYTLYVIVTNSAAPAEVEPNNAAETATPIMEAGAQFGLRSASINPGGDVDFYSFPANAGEVLFISADGNPERDGTTTPLEVDLLSPTGSLIINGGNSVADERLNPNTAEGFCFQLITSGTHLIRVTAAFNQQETGTYSLLTSRTAAAANIVTITSVNPPSVLVGSAGVTLTVNGTNFINGSVVRFNGQDRVTTFVSATQLTAALTPADLAAATTVSITVFNPGPGGGPSNAASFAINNPVPTLTGLDPSTVAGGGPGFTLTVNGTNFVGGTPGISGSLVRINGQIRATTFVSPVQLRTTITAADISSAGPAVITVINPTPGGGISNELNLTVTLPSGGFEGDVTPRPLGNGIVSVADWVQVGRFAAALDTAASGSEFQRADTAPREGRGNGAINMQDWVQTGRYAAGLDPVQPGGGPTVPTALQPLEILSATAGDAPARQARLVSLSLPRGRGRAYAVEFDARGDENAIGLSLEFEVSWLGFKSVSRSGGLGGAVVIVNDTHSAQGRVGLALALPAGQSFKAGRQRVLVLEFEARGGGPAAGGGVGFGDFPIARQVVDVGAAELATTWAGAGARSLPRLPARQR